MLGRLFGGALVGALIGAVAAIALVKGLALASLSGVLFYAVAAAVGALTGLFAGKPIWAAGGKVEAGLKAFFGALLATGALFALRRFVHVEVDLARFGAGAGPLGEVPAAALPLIAATLGALFGVDNTPEASDGTSKARVAEPARVAGRAATTDEDDADAEAAPRRAKR